MSNKKDSTTNFGEGLIQALLASFDAAYHLHAVHKESIEAILIRYDIAAAGERDTPHRVILTAHRAAIRSAVEAADLKIPQRLARVELLRRFRHRLAKYIE